MISPKSQLLFEELIAALKDAELYDNVRDFNMWASTFSTNDQTAKIAAVRKMKDRCHPKLLGDYRLSVKGNGSYPVVEFLERLINSFSEDLNKQ
ncbi:hypothetical protein [Salinimonas iocasae]|uniref:Uncharacterized protein n=1 Tax=Salinimonas iocasae TaxID=2572577 RepID=A0A5B7YD90_9ALTE|nr:hypothetical protein [Salinimonas iocasae]QCZ93515.1 hypothetical protein FBQ74_08445 [Salinimonas iocasae]